MNQWRQRAGLLSVVATFAVVLAACPAADDGEPVVDEPGSEQVAPETETPEHDTDTHATDGSNPFASLKAAANHVGDDGSARTLAAGIATAAELDGDIDSPAAQTWAQLSTLLQEHVYLAGIAVDTGLGFGLDSPEFEAAAGTLDENSVALADLVGSVAGDDNREAFLGLWREHIGFFVDYARGAAEGDEQTKQQALDDLDGYRAQAGAFFEDITGGALPADAVAESLSGHIQTLSNAIDLLAAGDPGAFDALRDAAHHVSRGGSARALAGGIAEAAGLEGDLDAAAVGAYVSLSTLLEEHVYLAGIAVKTAYTEGLDSGAFEAAAGTLDENSVALADLVGSVAGDDNREAFLGLWREHIGFFVDYARGAAEGDEQTKQQALDDLDGYRAQAGAFFEDITGGELPADAVADALKGHIETLSGAIDDFAAALTR